MQRAEDIVSRFGEPFSRVTALDDVSTTASIEAPAIPPVVFERPSLEALYRNHARHIAAVAARLLGRRDEIDDVVQDVFLDAHRGLSSVHELGAIKAWLTTIAVRHVRRRLRRRRLVTFLGLDDVEAAAAGPGPDVSAMLSQVYARLDRVSANQRIAWCLRYVEGEKLSQVASVCGCSIATVKRWIAGANQQLADLGAPLDE